MRSDATGKVHALLRRWLPRRLRAAYGEEMERVFRERLDERRRRGGIPGAVVAWVQEAWDLADTGMRLRTSDPTGGGGGMGGWIDDLRGALRSLRRSPGFALFAVGTLALGIGATIGFAAFLDRIVLRPVDFPGGDRMVMAWRARKGGGVMISPDLGTRERVRSADVFESVAATGGGDVAWSTDEGPQMIGARTIDTSLPAMAGLPPVLGRWFVAEDLVGEGAAVVVLSQGLWKRAFASDPGVIGTSMRLDGLPRTIVGVAPEELRAPGPGNPDVDVWLPLPAEGQPGLNVFARLREGVTLEQANERMKALDLAAAAADPAVWETRLVPVAEMVTARLRSPLEVVGAGVVLLLLIACINVANLLLARGDARVRDTAVRAAVGAGRLRLRRETLFEALVIALAASALGLALAAGALAAVRALRPDNLRLLDALHLDPVVTAAAVACAVATVLLFGTLPLFRRVRTRPGSVLTERAGTSGIDSVGLRRLLLVGEVALSFALLAGATQIVSTLSEIRSRDPGLAVDELLTVGLRLPAWRFPDAASRTAALERVMAELRRQPGVQDVTAASGAPPVTGILFGKSEAEGRPAPDGQGEDEIFFTNSVEPGYFETVGQEVLEGRGFIRDDQATEPAPYVLGASAAEHFFPEGDAVGRRIRVGGEEWHTVVGVVRDVWMTGAATENPYPQIYGLAQADEAGTLLVRADDPRGIAPAVRELVRGVDGEIPVLQVAPMAAGYADALSRERLVAWLLTGFAVTAGLLAAIGLYGVVTQIAVRRTREFGIRISLGAAPAAVFRMALAAGAGAVAAGLVAGAGLAWAALRFLETGIAGLADVDPPAFVLAAAVLALTTLAAMSVPAARAARTDASVALRAE